MSSRSSFNRASKPIAAACRFRWVFNDQDFGSVRAANQPAPRRAQEAHLSLQRRLANREIPADGYELRRLLDRDVDAKS